MHRESSSNQSWVSRSQFALWAGKALSDLRVLCDASKGKEQETPRGAGQIRTAE